MIRKNVCLSFIKLENFRSISTTLIANKQRMTNSFFTAFDAQIEIYHHQVCLVILMKTNSTSVARILGFLAEEKLSNDEFCSSYAGFFVISFKKIHVPLILTYSPKNKWRELYREHGFHGFNH